MRQHQYIYQEEHQIIDQEIRKAFLEKHSEDHLNRTLDVIAVRRYRNKVIRIINDLSILRMDKADMLREVGNIPTSRIHKDWASIVVEVLFQDL